MNGSEMPAGRPPLERQQHANWPYKALYLPFSLPVARSAPHLRPVNNMPVVGGLCGGGERKKMRAALLGICY